MVKKNIFSTVFSAIKKVDKNKKDNKNKSSDTVPAARIAKMQRYVDLSEEKRRQIIEKEQKDLILERENENKTIQNVDKKYIKLKEQLVSKYKI
jgi:hypothetical protein